MTADLINELAANAGVTWFDYQVEAFEDVLARGQDTASLRVCLYFRTGAGKTLTALAIARLVGAEGVLVIAPPSTHGTWRRAGAQLGVEVEAISHAKFRQKSYGLSKTKAIIADEMHQFGGHTGQGWQKLARAARGLQAPLIMASATPSYNDAERVYCVQHILDPISTKGGFIEFLYKHCKTAQNPFSATPDVTGFHQFKDAEEYLANLEGVYYLPDELVYNIEDIYVGSVLPDSFEHLNYNPRARRIMASQIEKAHARINHQLIDDSGRLDRKALRVITDVMATSKTPVLLYFNHATIAEAAALTFNERAMNYGLITGKTSPRLKSLYLDEFRAGKYDVLIGTASLGTGTDGLDKVSDTLILADDTDDDSLRRQIIGRIMPRGADADATKKRVVRLLLS